MKTYNIKATIILEVNRTVEGEDHQDVKEKLKEELIREGFNKIKISYIKSDVVKEKDTSFKVKDDWLEASKQFWFNPKI